MYDIIVIGARVAGATFALEMARKGHRILVLDKMMRGQDALSTHFVWPRGASYLNRLGLLDRVLEKTPSATEIRFKIENFNFSGEVPVPLLETRFERLHGGRAQGIQSRYFSARRKFIDTVLIDAAIEAGAEVRLQTAFEHLLFDGSGRPSGVQFKTPDGREEKAYAPLIVGADGKRSSVAQQLGVVELEPRKGCTFACFSYFTDTGLPVETLIQKRGRLSLAHCATNDGAHMVLLFGPEAFYPAFAKNRRENFYAGLNLINPEVAETVQAGRQTEPFYSTAEQAGFMRRASGAGFALLGDAACFKDQCTASGMTHALRDSALLAGLLPADLSEAGKVDEALEPSPLS